MSKVSLSMMLIFLAFCMWNIHLIYPINSTVEYGNIPFRPEIPISKDGHLTYAGERCGLVIVMFCVYLMSGYHKYFKVFTLLFFGYLLDYVLYYNGTLFIMFNVVPVSYTLIAALVMFFLIIKSIFYD